jgi:hypothetical protein
MKLLRISDNQDEHINHVCYHPIQIKYLMRGENVEPICYAVEYEYESLLHCICDALGWQGGVWDQAIAEIKKLKRFYNNKKDNEE